MSVATQMSVHTQCTTSTGHACGVCVSASTGHACGVCVSARFSHTAGVVLPSTCSFHLFFAHPLSACSLHMLLPSLTGVGQQTLAPPMHAGAPPVINMHCIHGRRALVSNSSHCNVTDLRFHTGMGAAVDASIASVASMHV